MSARSRAKPWWGPRRPPAAAPHYTCPRCHRTSYNANDVEQRYCGACHQFDGQVPDTRFLLNEKKIRESSMAELEKPDTTLTWKCYEIPGTPVKKCFVPGIPVVCARLEDIQDGDEVLVAHFTGWSKAKVKALNGSEASAESESSVWWLRYHEEHGWLCWGGGNLKAIAKLEIYE